MGNFKIAWPILKQLEGGISRNPKDNAARNPAPGTNGAHTNKGITWTTFVGMAHKIGYVATPTNFLAMSDDIANKIYKAGYWDILMLDKVSSNAVCYVLFDFAVNSGPETAIHAVQRCLNELGNTLADDGVMGKKTVAAINDADSQELIDEVTDYRAEFIRNSGKIDASLKGGLIQRVEDVATLVKKKSSWAA